MEEGDGDGGQRFNPLRSNPDQISRRAINALDWNSQVRISLVLKLND